MPISYVCGNPECGKMLRVPDGLAGKLAKCPTCGQVGTVPASPAPPAEPEPITAESVEEVVEVLPAGPERPKPRNPQRNPQPEVAERGRRPRRRRYLEEDDEDDRRPLRCPFCESRIEAEDTECPDCGKDLDHETVREQYHELKRQRTQNQLLSFVFGLPGLIIGVAGAIMGDSLVGVLMLVGGGILLWVGIGFGVAYKRYNLAWILLGLLGIIGLIVLVFVPDEKGKRLRRFREILNRR